MITELILFIIFGAVAVATGIALIVVKNPVHSAMLLVVNFFCIAVFYLIMNAQFVAVIQILVYAGAIMVLFVFVIMLLNATGDIERLKDEIPYSKIIGLVLAVLLFVEGLIMLRSGIFRIAAADTTPLKGDALLTFGTPEAVAQKLYTTYLLPFELTSVLLLVAMIGALVIGKRRLT